MIVRLLFLTFSVAILSSASPSEIGRSVRDNSLYAEIFQQEETDHYSRQEFAYDADAVLARGEIQVDKARGSINFIGTYFTSYAEVARGTQLSFQLHGEDGRLLKFENPRFQMRDVQGGNEATFDFTLHVGDLPLDDTEKVALLRFNLVLEGQYWYHDEHASLRQPFIRIQNLPQAEKFETKASFMPLVAPVNTPSKAASWVRRTAASVLEESSYRQSIEMFTGDFNKRVENPRKLMDFSGSDSIMLINTLQSSAPSAHKVRQGYVWDGVRWYDSNNYDNFRNIYFVSEFVYLLLIFISLCVVYALIRLARRTKRKEFFLPIWAVAIVLLLSIIVHSLSSNYIIFFVSAAIIATIYKYNSLKTDLYLVCFVCLAGMEFYWSYLFKHSHILWSGYAFSVSLYALLLLPLLWVKKTFSQNAILVAISVLSLLYYISFNAYHDFFKHYPSWSALGNVGQLSESVDTIAELLGPRHYLCIACWIPGWVWAIGRKNCR